jgi:aryl-alcohol dehydrogenase-like predicted oxidoreductase
MEVVQNMKYVSLEGKSVPSIAIGTWSWGTGFNGGNSVFGNAYQADDLKPVFQKGIQLGFTLWDTAAVYGLGASECILGSFLKEYKNHTSTTIATKFTPNPLQRKNAIHRSIENSLQRLGRKDVDLFWIHNAHNVKRWTKEAAFLMKDGLVGAIGVSNHNLDDVKQAADILAREGIKLAAVQNHYSLLYRGHEHSGLLNWCHENGILFFPYMVLEQGALCGKYSVANPLPSNSRRGKAFDPAKLSTIEPLIKEMKKISESRSVGPTEIAIAWALSKGTVPIIGVTKEHHITAAAAAMDVSLSAGEIESIERIAESTGIVVKASWEPKT